MFYCYLIHQYTDLSIEQISSSPIKFHFTHVCVIDHKSPLHYFILTGSNTIIIHKLYSLSKWFTIKVINNIIIFLENNLRFPFSKVDKQEARNNTSKFEEWCKCDCPSCMLEYGHKQSKVHVGGRTTTELACSINYSFYASTLKINSKLFHIRYKYDC